jgi:hypothetical protein
VDCRSSRGTRGGGSGRDRFRRRSLFPSRPSGRWLAQRDGGDLRRQEHDLSEAVGRVAEGRVGFKILLQHPCRKANPQLDAFVCVCHRRTEVQGSHESNLHQQQLICSLWTVGLRAAHAGVVQDETDLGDVHCFLPDRRGGGPRSETEGISRRQEHDLSEAVGRVAEGRVGFCARCGLPGLPATHVGFVQDGKYLARQL